MSEVTVRGKRNISKIGTMLALVRTKDSDKVKTQTLYFLVRSLDLVLDKLLRIT